MRPACPFGETRHFPLLQLFAFILLLPPFPLHSLFLTNEDELRRQLDRDSAGVLAALGPILGELIQATSVEQAGAESRLPLEKLHVLVVDAIRARFHRVVKPAMTFVLDATQPEVSSSAMHTSVLHALQTFARSGIGIEPHPSGGTSAME